MTASWAKLLMFAGAVGVAAGQTRGELVTQWNLELRDSIRATSTPPPAASRAMAMVHAAMFDAVNAVEGRFVPYRFAGSVPAASAQAAAARSARDVLAQLFPARTATFDALLNSQLALIPDGPAKTEGVALGAAVAADMVAWRGSDGSSAASSYQPSAEPGRWRPTGPEFLPALLPQWGSVTPFALPSGGAVRPAAPPALTSQAYADAVAEVRALGSASSEVRTAEQTQIARFWANGAGTETPPGHWNRIALRAAEGRQLDLSDQVRMLAMLNVALADAAIVSWDCKYHYDLWRPITAIREASADGNPLTEADASWSPLLVTPPFPEYTSGHSTFSAAGATVLAAFFGTDAVPFSVGSDDLAGVERSYTGFWAAAEEAGLSRIYGGIHFSFGNEAGLASGAAVGRLVSTDLFAVIPEPGHSALVLAVGGAALVRRGRRGG